MLNAGLSGPIDAQGFQNALYMIDIGQNDVNALLSNLPYDQVIAKFPPILAEIKDAVQVKLLFLIFFLRPRLVPRNFCKIFHIPRHIESLDACMEY